MTEEVAISPGLVVEYHIGDRMEYLRELGQILTPQIEDIPRWGMAVVYFFYIFRELLDRIETISRKYHAIILSEKVCRVSKSPSENLMSQSLGKNRCSEWDHTTSESEFSRIETPP